MRCRSLALGLLIGCGPALPSADDETGDPPAASSSSSAGTSTESSSGDPTLTQSSTSTESSGESSDTDTSTDTETSTETGDMPPPESCAVPLDDTLWSLPCELCEDVLGLDDQFFAIFTDGSQIPNDIDDCAAHSFEGRVRAHPSPDTWVIDACPCDLPCDDPQIIDLARDIEHPRPDLLPDALGVCVRVDVWRDTVNSLGPSCGPIGVALWNLDQLDAQLVYAQGNSMGEGIGPFVLGPLTVERDALLCDDHNIFHDWAHYELRFTLEQDSIVVPHQSAATWMHPSGDLEARNVSAVSLYSESLGVFPVMMWSLRPQP